MPSIYSPPTKSLSVIVPAYNEEARLSQTLDEALRCAHLVFVLLSHTAQSVCMCR
jgi:cellulose synthase/poly-beta-1,6-N-acetylglucosamine synthase-like glycosyltransferase